MHSEVLQGDTVDNAKSDKEPSKGPRICRGRPTILTVPPRIGGLQVTRHQVIVARGEADS